jgi:hypothetical protein
VFKQSSSRVQAEFKQSSNSTQKGAFKRGTRWVRTTDRYKVGLKTRGVTTEPTRSDGRVQIILHMAFPWAYLLSGFHKSKLVLDRHGTAGLIHKTACPRDSSYLKMSCATLSLYLAIKLTKDCITEQFDRSAISTLVSFVLLRLQPLKKISGQSLALMYCVAGGMQVYYISAFPTSSESHSNLDIMV